MDRFGNHDGHLLKSNETFPAYKGQPASVRVDQPETSETDVCLCTHNIGAYIVTNIISGVPVHNYSITGSIPRRTTRLRKDSVTEICFPVLGVWVFANVFFFSVAVCKRQLAKVIRPSAFCQTTSASHLACTARLRKRTPLHLPAVTTASDHTRVYLCRLGTVYIKKTVKEFGMWGLTCTA